MKRTKAKTPANLAQFMLLRRPATHPRRLFALDQSVFALLSLLLAGSFFYLLLALNRLQADAFTWPALLILTLAFAVFWGLSYFKKMLMLVVPLLILAGLGVYVLGPAQLPGFLQSLYALVESFVHWGTGQSATAEPPALYVPALALGAALGTVVLCRPQFKLSFAILVLVPLYIFQKELTVAELWTVLVLQLFLLLLLAGRQESPGVSGLKHLPWPNIAVSVLVLALFLGLAPQVPEHFLRDEDTAQFLQELLLPEGKSTIQYYEFNLGEVGFYPEHDRLGGPVELSHQDYMVVSQAPDHDFYLRGAVFGPFAGDHWERSLMEPNQRFRNDSPRTEQLKTFDYPGYNGVREDLLQEFFVSAPFHMQPLRKNIQVGFVTGKPRRLQRADQDEFYFNPQGQLYNAEAFDDQGYSGTMLFPKDGLGKRYYQQLYTDLDQGRVKLRAISPDEHYAQAFQTAFPELFKQLANPALTEGQRLQTIVDAVRNFAPYNLTVAAPAPGSDFLLHFLQMHEGYCVHFATTLTLLLRDLGYDARYVEGFVVPQNPQAGAKRVISSDMAHAWTEIYVEGLGWMPLDATPGEHADELRGDQGGESEPPPTPTTPPTSAAEQTELQTSMSMSQSVIPSSSQSPAPTAASIPWADYLRLFLKVLLALAPFLLLLAYGLWRRKVLQHRRDPDYLLKHYAPDLLLQKIWLDMRTMSRLLGQPELPADTILKQVDRLQGSFPELLGQREQLELLRILEKRYYAEEALTERELQFVVRLYVRLDQALATKLGKGQFILKRCLWRPGHPL